MELRSLECHSAEMARKEWLAGLIAYNLIRWTMAAAAALAQVPIEILSFSRTRELLAGWCVRHAERPSAGVHWLNLLHRVAQATLPKRRRPRPPEVRAVRPFANHPPYLIGSRAQARKQLAKKNRKS